MARYRGVRAVVLGLEINGLSVVRSLGRAKVLVVGIDSDIEQATALSKYLLTRYKTSDVRGAVMIDSLLNLAKDRQQYAIFPTMDATVLLLSEERDRLPENLMYRLPDKQVVRQLLHKGTFRKLCREMGIPNPGYAVVGDLKAFEDSLGELRFPLVIKSTLKKMGAGPKASVVEDINQAVSFYREQGEGEVILEEWIPGMDRDVCFCLQVYGSHCELLASFTGRKIRQWPPRVGGTASAEPAEIPEVEETTTRLFKHVQFKGICSMEYKYDAREGCYYAIEPTVGRTDFQSGIAPANGINIPLIAFADMAGVSVKTGRRRLAVKWVHPLGDIQSAAYYMERGELTRKEWKRSLAGPRVTTLFALDDPGPWVSDLFRRGLSRLKRMVRKKGGTP